MRAIQGLGDLASSRGLEEQSNRDSYRRGPNCIPAKFAETLFEGDDGAAPARQAEMNEADGLFQ